MYKPIYLIKATRPIWYATRLPLYACMVPYLLIRKKSVQRYFKNEWVINRIRQKAGLMVTSKEKNSFEGNIVVRYRIRGDLINLKFNMQKKAKKNDKELFLETCKDGTGMRATNLVRKKGFILFSLYDNFKPIMNIKYDAQKFSIGTSTTGLYYWLFIQFPHALIVGATGSGKTNFLENLIYTMNLYEMDIYCIDGKVVDLNLMNASFKSYVPFYDSEYDEVMNEIKSFSNRMSVRFREMTEKRIKNFYQSDNYAPQVLIIEEHTSLLDHAKKDWKESFLSTLSYIIKMGRGAGFFIILIMQRPDVTYLSGNARSNINLKIVLGAAEPETYSMTLNDNTLEPLERGQAWVKQGNEINILAIPKYEDIVDIMEEKKNVTK